MKMIVEVDNNNIVSAAEIHSESWRESHSSFCSSEFVALHTVERQTEYLRKELDDGKRLFMLILDKPVGIVSIKDNMIENLYVLPSEQHKGYGTELLLFAMEKCNGIPSLWVLNNNINAYALYVKMGFRATGNEHKLSETLSEIEMILEKR